MYLVSVVICTYNSSLTVKRALNSVFSQTGLGVKFKLQVIAVDDCSTDDTLDLMSQYDVEIYRNHRNSGGPNEGRNKALKESKGDFITFIDHDDEWLPDKITTQLDCIGNGSIVTTGYIDLDSKLGKKRFVQNINPDGFIKYGTNVTFLKRLQRSKNGQIVYMAGIMIKQDLKTILFEDQYGMVDYDWVLRIFEDNSSIEITKPLFVRYVDSENLSLNEKYRLNDYQISSSIIRYYAHKYPQESKIGLKRLNGSMARFYYLLGNVAEARKFFLKANLTVINILYYLTTFWGRQYVVKRFKVFG